MKTATENARTTPRDPAATAATAAAPMLQGFADAMESWLGAQRRLAEAVFAEATSSPAIEQMRRRGAGLFHGAVENFAGSAAALAAVTADHARFAGRVAERQFDAAFGPHAARSPEALAATGSALVSDCLEQMVATSERLLRIGANALDATRIQATDAAGCCRGAASGVAK